MKFCLPVLALLAMAVSPGLAEMQDKTATINGTTVHYKVILPKGYDPAKTYPTDRLVLTYPLKCD